jgi:hypothetical protein
MGEAEDRIRRLTSSDGTGPAPSGAA